MASTGLWLVGARGGISTTVIAGLAALKSGRKKPTGLITETTLFDGCDLPPLEDLVVGGHEIRTGTLLESAQAINSDSGSIRSELIEAIRADLEAADERIRPGILINAGEAILSLEGVDQDCRHDHPAEAVAQVEKDLRTFIEDNRLESLVVAILSSTEASIAEHPAHSKGIDLLSAMNSGEVEAFRSSTIYAIAAANVGAGFINFTPSPAALLPATCELLEAGGSPYAGSDGKTGETLVKSALAPMFAQRALKVLSWQGYNMLGDRDGEILAHEENRQTKLSSKGELIEHILGEDVHNQVSIDYVPSLGDNKTAWDLIHFEGFLDHRMTMQFTWQGCDAILAAPLVLDLARLLAAAGKRGESGLQKHCAIFFKSPHRCRIHDLASQYRALADYARRNSSTTS